MVLFSNEGFHSFYCNFSTILSYFERNLENIKFTASLFRVVIKFEGMRNFRSELGLDSFLIHTSSASRLLDDSHIDFRESLLRYLMIVLQGRCKFNFVLGDILNNVGTAIDSATPPVSQFACPSIFGVRVAINNKHRSLLFAHSPFNLMFDTFE